MSSFFMNWINVLRNKPPLKKGGFLFIIAKFQFVWYTLYKVKEKHFASKKEY